MQKFRGMFSVVHKCINSLVPILIRSNFIRRKFLKYFESAIAIIPFYFFELINFYRKLFTLLSIILN